MEQIISVDTKMSRAQIPCSRSRETRLLPEHVVQPRLIPYFYHLCPRNMPYALTFFHFSMVSSSLRYINFCTCYKVCLVITRVFSILDKPYRIWGLCYCAMQTGLELSNILAGWHRQYYCFCRVHHVHIKCRQPVDRILSSTGCRS